MSEPNRERKNEIKAINRIQLNDEQKEAKALIYQFPIVIITGRAGCGKSLVAAQTALDMIAKKMYKKMFITRATVEVGDSLGYLPGGIDEKFNPYIEAFMDNLLECASPELISGYIEQGRIVGCTTQFIRGKTMNDILIIEEGQNLKKSEMLALVTRLGKGARIIINGDFEQSDIKDTYTGLHYVKELSEKCSPNKIKYIKLKENHRDDLVGEILAYEYGK